MKARILRWRLRRARRRWHKADLELRTEFIAVSQIRHNRLYWLRDTILPERIAYLQDRLVDLEIRANPNRSNPFPKE